jgi:cytochrome c
MLLAMTVAFGVVTPALADQALASSKNCLACHGVDKWLVGPSYQCVAWEYATDKAAPERLAAKIRNGGGGIWGVVPMPANPQVKEDEAKKLATWILSLKPLNRPICKGRN